MRLGALDVRMAVMLGAASAATAILSASSLPAAPPVMAVLFHHTFDDSRDARLWMGYDYEIIDDSRHDGFTPVVSEPSGGSDGHGYIWLDDRRWGVDVPDGNNILAVSTRRGTHAFPPDLRDAVVDFWVRGQNLDLKGGYANLYIYHGETGTTTHLPGRRFEIRNDEWTHVTIRLEVDESLWYRSWWSAATGGNVAPQSLTYGGNQGGGAAPIDVALKDVGAIGIAFREFREEVTGRLDIDNFKVSRLVRTCRPARDAVCAGAFLSAGGFARADWRGAVMTNADLSLANLEGADLRGADFRGADLRRARLDGAQLQGADLTGAQMFKATLRGAVLARATLNQAVMTHADASFADFTDARLRGLVAGHATFFNARIDRADLTGADLRSADLRSVSMRGATARELTVEGARMARADVSQADLGRMNAEGADLSFADLSRAQLGGAVLAQTNLFRARLVGADVEGATLTGAQMKYAV